jgi:outer membrane receptor protein involved in Fe transport
MRVAHYARVAALHASILASLVSGADNRLALSGLVLDPAGAAVPQAQVTLLSPRQSFLQSGVTDAGGRFSFPAVPAGSYVLLISARGMAEQRLPIRLEGTGTTEVAAHLHLQPLRTELTVTASPGSAESIDSVSQSVNVIGREAIRERSEAVLAQAVIEEAGLALQRTSPTLAGVYVRGLTGNNVNVFLDGVRYTTSAQRGGINTFLDLTDPSAVESIEVLRGPNSAQYGSDALGGSVQLLSQPPLSHSGRRRVATSLETYFNSADLASGSNFAASYAVDRFTFQANIAGRRVSTLRTGKESDSHCAITRFLGLDSDLLISDTLPDTAFTQYGGSARIGWAATPTSYLTGYYIRGQQDGGKRYDQLLGGDGNLVADLRNLMLDLAYFRYEKSGLGWFDQFSATYSFNIQREERVNQGGNGNPLAPIQHEYERTKAQGLQALARKTLWQRHNLSLGGEYYFEGIRSPSFAADPANRTSVVRRGRIPDQARYRSGGVYLQDAVDAIHGHLGITGSVRVSGAWYQALSADSPIVDGERLWPDDAMEAWDTTFRVGSVWTPKDGFSIFGNVSRGFRAPNMTDLGTYGLTGSGYEVAAPDIAGLGGTVGSSAGSSAISTGVPVEQLKPETSMGYELGLRFWNRRIDADVALFSSRIRSTIEKQSLILPPGAVGTELGGQPVIAQGPTGIVYVPAATNPVLVRANYGEAQVYGIEQTLDWRIRDDLVLSAILTCLRARNTRTGQPPDIEGGTPAPDGYLKIRYQFRKGRFWLEPSVHAAARQERLSSLDLEDRRTGAMRSRASIRRFFYNGATVRGLVGPGSDGIPGNGDDVLLATGETVAQVQNRVLGPGVDSAPLFSAVPGYVVLDLRAGIRLGENQDCLLGLTNIGDRNYRGISWGLDAAGRSLSISYRIKL